MHSNQPLEMYTMQISSQRYCLFLIRASILLHFFVKKLQDVHFSHVFMQDFDVYTLKSGTIRHKNMFYNIKTRLDNRTTATLVAIFLPQMPMRSIELIGLTGLISTQTTFYR